MSRMERHRARREGIVSDSSHTIASSTYKQTQENTTNNYNEKIDFDNSTSPRRSTRNVDAHSLTSKNEIGNSNETINNIERKTRPTRSDNNMSTTSEYLESINELSKKAQTTTNVNHNVVDLEELKKSAINRQQNASFDLDEAFTRLKKDISNPNMDTQLEVMTNLMSDRYDEFNSTQQLRKPVESKNKVVDVNEILSTVDKEVAQPKKKSIYKKISALNPRDTKKDELKANLLNEQLKVEKMYAHSDDINQENKVSNLAHLTTPVVHEKVDNSLEAVEKVDFSKEKQELDQMINEIVANENNSSNDSSSNANLNTDDSKLDMLRNPVNNTTDLLFVKKEKTVSKAELPIFEDDMVENEVNAEVSKPSKKEIQQETKKLNKKVKKKDIEKNFENTVEQSQLAFDKMVMEAENDKASKVLIAIIVILLLVFVALMYMLVNGVF